MYNQITHQPDLTATTPLCCEKCGNQYFTQVLHIRKQSALLTGSSKPSLIPIPVFQCTACGHVNEEFKPTILQKKDKLKQ